MAVSDQSWSAGSANAASRRKRRRRQTFALVLVLCAGASYYWLSRPGTEAIEEEDLIVPVVYGNIENLIPATGSLQPREVVPVGARASGELEEILVEVGDFVQAGDIVARIDAREQLLRVESSRLNLENQRNQLAQRELALEIAENNLERTERMHAEDASTAQELENAENDYLNARTSLDNLGIQIRQSETNLEREEVQLDYTEIRAPISGTVISLDQQEGATLNATRTAPTVMQIADLTTLTVETEISEADIQDLVEGVDVYFTTPSTGDRRWYGKLRKIDPMGAAQNNVVMFKGSFDVDNRQGDLLPNMTTSVNFVTSSAMNVLTVPVGALISPDGAAVRVEQVMPDGSRETRDVFVGLQDKFNAEVISGLSAGDRVVSFIDPADLEEEVDAVTSASW